MEQNGEHRNKPTKVQPFDSSQKESKTYTEEKTGYLTNGCGKTGYSYVED